MKHKKYFMGQFGTFKKARDKSTVWESYPNLLCQCIQNGGAILGAIIGAMLGAIFGVIFGAAKGLCFKGIYTIIPLSES